MARTKALCVDDKGPKEVDITDEECEEDSSEDEEESSESSSSEEEKIVKKHLPERTGRGARMKTLLGNAHLLEEEGFWKEMFQDEASDEDYTNSRSSATDDSLDSDFDSNDGNRDNGKDNGEGTSSSVSEEMDEEVLARRKKKQKLREALTKRQSKKKEKKVSPVEENDTEVEDGYHPADARRSTRFHTIAATAALVEKTEAEARSKET